ncbi:unnamed protein product [Trichogramma brassicae]|uniref:Endonuclease/exonuclease/phosphatase domain-containing protein n=1 Tax=Trichogramma brassicae TaxID=86971 RepID=A0A6H5ILG8_9HYME|nr:unnamed protein product [Trichogramma brassicae]
MATITYKLLSVNADVLSLSESWLTSTIDDRSASIPGYSLLRTDRGLPGLTENRQWRQGGGVACYVREAIKYTILYSPTVEHINDVQFLDFELHLDRQKLLFISVYRLPDGRVLNGLFKFYQSVCHRYNHVVMVGDFNVDMRAGIQEYHTTELRSHIEQSLWIWYHLSQPITIARLERGLI